VKAGWVRVQVEELGSGFKVSGLGKGGTKTIGERQEGR
jgi:hypothetical protein